MKCRICGCDIENREIINNVDIDVNNFYVAPCKIQGRRMEFYHCLECGHGQIDNVLEDNHYEKYNLLNINNKSQAGGGNIELRLKHYKDVLKKLKELAIDSEKILDIGCGTGEVLQYAQDFFDESEGIEPSKEEYEIAIGKGCKVINAFFDSTFCRAGYSAFISTQVFEHLDYPVETLKMAGQILRGGGTGYIEVPNGQRIYNNSNFYNVYCEHINYYTPSSLAKMAYAAGLEIISIGETGNGNHLEMYVRKNQVHIGFEEAKKLSYQRIKTALSNHKVISIWGSGVKGKVFLQLLNEKEQKAIRYLFDNNQYVQGCYRENCILPISKPESKKINENDMIIITAVEYKNEITCELRKKYNYKGDIIYIDAY